jgi:hypothetical protein
VEVADVFRAHGEAYRERHRLSGEQRAAMVAIERCRTAALGGHLERCDSCGASRPAYNSCRNRHCPKCQTLAKERWVEARRAELLPVGYFHVVFTLPHALHPLARKHPGLIYELLFWAASETLQRFADEELGGELGVSAILHTWGQDLSQHIHLHCVVTGGALARDGSRWAPASRSFLFAVHALSKVFRGKYLEGLKGALDAGKVHSVPAREARALLARLWEAKWVVYAEPPFGGPEQVLEYLGRYTHRVAISNDRLVALRDGKVRFRWRDYRDGGRMKVMEVEAATFIGRFLLHVLPKGFVRIRHYGLLANRRKAKKLQRCRLLLGKPPDPPEAPTESVAETMLRLTGTDIHLCPVCRRGRLRIAEILPPLPEPRAPPST